MRLKKRKVRTDVIGGTRQKKVVKKWNHIIKT
jgi:hypothetical protein